MDKDTQEMFDTIDQVADGVYVCRKDNKVTLHDKNNDFETKQVVHIVKIGSIYIGSDYNRNTYGAQNIVAINGFIYFSEAKKCLNFEGRYMMVPSYNNRILMIWELDKEDGLFTVYDTESGETILSIPTRNHTFEVKTCNGHEYSIDIVIHVYNSLMARQLVGSLEESYGVAVMPSGEILHGKYPDVLDEFFNKHSHFDGSTRVTKGNKLTVTLKTGKTEKYNLYCQMYN